jgi:hypothetical protein
MLRKDYYRKGSVEKKVSGRESQWIWRQAELIDGKPPAVKWLWLWLWPVFKGKLYFCRRLRVPDNVLQLRGQDIPFVNNIKCLGVTFDRTMPRRRHIERTAAKALRTYGRTYSLFRNGRLSTKIKLTLYKALIRWVITYACPIWEHAADTHLLKLQRLQNRVLRAIGNLDRCTSVCEFHVAFKILYVYDYITKLCITQAEVILSYVNPNICGIG